MGFLFESYMTPEDKQRMKDEQAAKDAVTAAQQADAERQKRFLEAIEASKQPTPQNPLAEQQTALNTALMQRALGQGPSPAEMQMKQAQEDQQKMALAQAASARGDINPALLQRNLMQNQAQAQQQMIGQVGAAQLAEQQQAQNAAIQGLSAQRQQEIANQQRIDDLAKSYEAMGLNSQQSRLMAELEVQKINAQIYGINVGAQTAAEQQSSDLTKTIVGGILGAAGGMGAAYATGGKK